MAHYKMSDYVPPDEPIVLEIEGQSYRVKKASARAQLRFSRLSDSNVSIEDEEWMFDLLKSHIEGIDPAVVDAMSTDELKVVSALVVAGQPPEKPDSGNVEAVTVPKESGEPSPSAPESSA